MNDFADYTLCNKNLQEKVQRIVEYARLPNDVTTKIVKAGLRILEAAQISDKRKMALANDLVDLLERLHAKTGQKFQPLITRLAEGALTLPPERLNEWYATAKQIANRYTEINQEKEQTITELLINTDTPEGLRDKIESLRYGELKELIDTKPWQISGRNGRMGEKVYRTKTNWKTCKE
ncbi:MAG: hypothetical protein QXT19_04025 [Candidatus Woesearchaeota archaeon]